MKRTMCGDDPLADAPDIVARNGLPKVLQDEASRAHWQAHRNGLQCVRRSTLRLTYQRSDCLVPHRLATGKRSKRGMRARVYDLGVM